MPDKVYSDYAFLAFIRDYADKHYGIPPTIREIMTGTGMRSTATAHFRLRCLTVAGLLYRHKHSGKLHTHTISPQGREWLEREDLPF